MIPDPTFLHHYAAVLEREASARAPGWFSDWLPNCAARSRAKASAPASQGELFA